MLDYLRKNPNRLLVILLVMLTVLNMVTAAYSELTAGECYYWFVSKNLELGYFEHPPFFALLDSLGVAMLGKSELAVRLLTTLIYPVTLYLFWTVVRDQNSDYRSAIRYFLVVFSIPIFHLYGVMATPDAPLLLAIAVTMWAFKRYVYSERWADNGYLYSILFLSLGFAMLGYAKYQGALVVMAVLISRPKMLIDWRVYVVAILALALYAPHLYWQYTHDFVSFKYHLIERHDAFRFGLTTEYLLNFIGTYNPFLTIPFIVMLCRRTPFVREPVERLMRVMSIFVLLFFLYSTFKGAHVEPRWLMPMVFGLIYLVCRHADRSERFARYVLRSTVFMGLIICALHVIVAVVEKPINRVELFGKLKNILSVADSLADAELFIMEDNHAAASMMNFYSDMPCYARPSLYRRSSHYQFRDLDTPYYGRCVAVEIGDRTRNSIAEDTLSAHYKWVVMPVVGKIYYYVDQHYIPSAKVDIALQSFPGKVLINQKLALLLSLNNPYDFEIPLGGVDGFQIAMHLRAANGQYWDIPIAFKEQSLGGGGMVKIATTVVIPELETGHYKTGFSLQRYVGGSWYNSKVFDLLVVNPKTRI